MSMSPAEAKQEAAEAKKAAYAAVAKLKAFEDELPIGLVSVFLEWEAYKKAAAAAVANAKDLEAAAFSLSTERLLENDIGCVSAAFDQPDAGSTRWITLKTQDDNVPAEVHGGDRVVNTVRRLLGYRQDLKIVVLFGGNPVGEEATFDHAGVCDDATLGVVVDEKEKSDRDSVIKIADAIVAKNPRAQNTFTKARISREALTKHAQFNDDGTLKSWSMRMWDLQMLPTEIGELSLTGTLNLERNKLRTLPKSIGGLVVGGGLNLEENKLRELPESFSQVSVGGHLHLRENQIRKLPDSIGQLVVGNALFLNRNSLTTLPGSIGQLTVRSLYLEDNRIATLPGGIRALQIPDTLNLKGNKLPGQWGVTGDYKDYMPNGVHGTLPNVRRVLL